MQRELNVDPNQLLHQYTPSASWMMLVLVLLIEPMGWTQTQRESSQTLLGYPLSMPAVAIIIGSALLALLVNLSTFLVIGATSALT